MSRLFGREINGIGTSPVPNGLTGTGDSGRAPGPGGGPGRVTVLVKQSTQPRWRHSKPLICVASKLRAGEGLLRMRAGDLTALKMLKRDTFIINIKHRFNF